MVTFTGADMNRIIELEEQVKKLTAEVDYYKAKEYHKADEIGNEVEEVKEALSVDNAEDTQSLLSAIQKHVDDSKTCEGDEPTFTASQEQEKKSSPSTPSSSKEFTDEQIAHAEKGEPEVPANMPDDAQWFLPVPSQTILDFRVVELKGDYWLFWHDDSHANDGMLPGFDEPNFHAKVYLLLEIEHYADPVCKNYWSCGMRSPYKIPKEAIDRHFISLRYRWMTDPNDYNIMSGHWGEKTLTTDGAGTFEQLLEEGISQEYILSQSIEQFNQIRGVPGTLTYAPGTEPIEVGPRGSDLMERLLEEGPESWVVDSVDDLPDWYWTLDEFEMNAGNMWGKIQIAPGHFVYYDGSGPRGRWNVPAMKNVKEPEVLPSITGKGKANPSVPDVSFFEAGELEWREFPPPPGGVSSPQLVLPVKILKYPDGFDEMLGRTWLADDTTISMSVREAYGMRYTETLTNAKELTFTLSQSYKWADMSPVKFTFYFRKENVMFKKSEDFELTREVPSKPSAEEQGSDNQPGLGNLSALAPSAPTPKVTLGKDNKPIFDIPEDVELTDDQRDAMWEEYTRLVKEKEDAEQKRVMDTAAKFPWIFSTNLGSKPIDPVLKACDTFEADDWDWETGYPLVSSLERELGHDVTEAEAGYCLEYYNAFCDGDREFPRPKFGEGLYEKVLTKVVEPVDEARVHKIVEEKVDAAVMRALEKLNVG